MRTPVLAVLSALVVIGSAGPGEAADRKQIEEAIKKGADFLRTYYNPTTKRTGGHGIGGITLSGIAMLEAGVSPDDPSLQYITSVVRDAALAQTETYQLSLCVIFLDLLGDQADVPVIQMLGVRLYAGLTATGGWGYNCWQNTSPQDMSVLRSVLRGEGGSRPNVKPPEKQDDGFLKPSETERARTPKLHPEVSRTLVAVQQTIRARGRTGVGGYGGDDNSNTQFGIIGLWVAARNGLPARDAFAQIEARFIRTQSPADGGWAYNTSNSMTGGSTVAMTCAGLIGLAVGGAARDTTRLTGEKVDRKGAPADDPFFNPTKGDGEKFDPAVKTRQVGSGQRDRAVTAAFRTLGAFLNSQQRGGDGGNGPRGPLGNFIGVGSALYTLWSLERVAVAFSADTIGGVDWYDWGSDIILKMQGPDGNFVDSAYEVDINTAFALLFLTKANFTKDLTAGNKGKEFGKVELRGGGGGGDAPLTAPPPKDRDAARRGGTGPASAPNDMPTPPGGFSLPSVAQPTEEGEAEKIAGGITGAGSDEDWLAKVKEARETKGGKWTRGLMLAAARLDGDKRRQAREALAERLTRMTESTLRDMLRDPEPELRRAACLACAMKDERGQIPDLIERITDPSDLVVRAARAGLASFAGVDYGPKDSRDEEAKVKAAADWAKWYNSQEVNK